MQGWPPEFSESREQLNGAGPVQPGPVQPGEPELPLDLGPAAAGPPRDAEQPGRPDDLKPLSELGLSDEFRPADDFAAPDEPRLFGVDAPDGADAPYGVPYAGGAPYGVPYPGGPYDPAGPYGAAGGYAPAGGYGAPGEPGAEDGDRRAEDLRAGDTPGQDVRDDGVRDGDVPDEDAPAGVVRDGGAPAGDLRDGDAPAGDLRDGDARTRTRLPGRCGPATTRRPGVAGCPVSTRWLATRSREKTSGMPSGPGPRAGATVRCRAPGMAPRRLGRTGPRRPGTTRRLRGAARRPRKATRHPRTARRDSLGHSAPGDSSPSSPGEPPAATHSADQAAGEPAAASDPPADPASRGSITDTMAAELAGWAAGELPGQAAARLASWATAGGAVARSRQQARLGSGGTATERVS